MSRHLPISHEFAEWCEVRWEHRPHYMTLVDLKSRDADVIRPMPIFNFKTTEETTQNAD